MTKTSLKSRLFSNKLKPQIEKHQSQLPPSSQSFKQKLLSGNGFIEYR